jgi:predicted phosphodiesterase
MGREAIATELGVSMKKVKRELEIYRAILRERESPEVAAEKDVVREKAEGELRHLRSKYQALAKRTALGDRIVEVARDCITAFPAPPPRPRLVTPNAFSDVEDAVLVYSDWHTGEVISPSETLNIGNYNKHVMARRVEYMTEKFIHITRMHRSTAKVDKAWVLCLGDICSGTLHDLEKTADADIFEQVLIAAYVLAQSVYEISKEFSSVVVVGVPGNHGRMTEKPATKRYFINWDTIAYQLAALFLQKVLNVEFRIPKSRVALVNINGHPYVVTHGDMGKGNLQNKAHLINDMLAYSGEHAEGVIVGHLHKPNIEESLNGPLVTNGTLAGASEFGVGRMAVACRPSQFILGVHNRQGLSFRYPVWLDNIPDPDAPQRFGIGIPEVWRDAQVCQAERVIH